jgi:predicted extracellular nuclease
MAAAATAGATWKNDFIELFNRGNTPVSLNGWSVQYVSAAGTGTWAVTNLTNVTLAPGQYYLVQEAAGAGGTQNLPTPDVSGGIAMSATNAKLALVSNTTAQRRMPVTAAIGSCRLRYWLSAELFRGSARAHAHQHHRRHSRHSRLYRK